MSLKTDYRIFDFSGHTEFETKHHLAEELINSLVAEELRCKEFDCYYPLEAQNVMITHGSCKRQTVGIPWDCSFFGLKTKKSFSEIENWAVGYYGTSRISSLKNIVREGIFAKPTVHSGQYHGIGIHSTPSFNISYYGYSPTIIYKTMKFRILLKVKHCMKDNYLKSLTWGHELEANEELRYEYHTNGEKEKYSNLVIPYGNLVKQCDLQDISRSETKPLILTT